MEKQGLTRQKKEPQDLCVPLINDLNEGMQFIVDPLRTRLLGNTTITSACTAVVSSLCFSTLMLL